MVVLNTLVNRVKEAFKELNERERDIQGEISEVIWSGWFGEIDSCWFQALIEERPAFTQEDYNNLIEEFGKDSVKEYFSNFSIYVKETDKVYLIPPRPFALAMPSLFLATKSLAKPAVLETNLDMEEIPFHHTEPELIIDNRANYYITDRYLLDRAGYDPKSEE